MNHGLIKSYTAGGAIAANTLLKFGADDRTMVPAVTATDAIIGVADLAASTGQMVDCIMDGIAMVKAGGTITRGQPITANASGQGVASTAAVGARIVGFALASAVSGDLFPVQLAPGFNNA